MTLYSLRRYLTYAKHATAFEAVSLVRKSMFALVAVLLSQNRNEQLAMAMVVVTLLIVSSALMRPWLQQNQEWEGGTTLSGVIEMKRFVDAEVAPSDGPSTGCPAPAVHRTNPLFRNAASAMHLEVADDTQRTASRHKSPSKRMSSAWRRRVQRGIAALSMLPSRISTTALELGGLISVMISLAAVPVVEQSNQGSPSSISLKGVSEVAVIVVNAAFALVSGAVLGVDLFANSIRKPRSWVRKAAAAWAFVKARCCCKRRRASLRSAGWHAE